MVFCEWWKKREKGPLWQFNISEQLNANKHQRSTERSLVFFCYGLSTYILFSSLIFETVSLFFIKFHLTCSSSHIQVVKTNLEVMSGLEEHLSFSPLFKFSLSRRAVFCTSQKKVSKSMFPPHMIPFWVKAQPERWILKSFRSFWMCYKKQISPTLSQKSESTPQNTFWVCVHL